MDTSTRDRIQTTIDDLNDELDEVDQQRDDIRSQIERAQATARSTGEYSNPDWFRRANRALRKTGIERQRVTRAIGEYNRRLREVNAVANRDLFRAAVVEIVDGATWERIVERHNRLLDGDI